MVERACTQLPSDNSEDDKILARWFVESLWRSSYSTRSNGDRNLERCVPYGQLSGPNLVGTAELIRLAISERISR
jgi:hypothetical protein